MPIDLVSLKKISDAKVAANKDRLKTINGLKDSVTNIKNRTLSSLSSIDDAIKAYLEGCGLLVSDDNAYQVYLNAYAITDDDLEKINYYYTLSRIDKKTGKQIEYYKDNLKMGDGSTPSEDKKTGWAYSTSTAKSPDELVSTSGLLILSVSVGHTLTKYSLPLGTLIPLVP